MIRQSLCAFVRRYPDPERDRAVVDERHPHMGAESPGLRAWKALFGALCHISEQALRLRGFRRPAETGPQALRRVGRERELGDEKEAALRVGHRQGHAALAVGEHAAAREALEQAVGDALVVAALDADEHEQARTDARDLASVDLDGGAVDALQESDHVPCMRSAELHGHDQVALPVLAEHECVRAHDVEPELAVERHGLRVVLPDSEPQDVATLPRRRVEGVLHQRARDAAAMPLGDDVEAREFGRTPCGDACVRAREPQLREADHAALGFREGGDQAALPDLALLDLGAEDLRAMRVHVLGRVARSEGVAEGALRENRERRRVARLRAPDPGHGSLLRALTRRFRNTSISFAACTSPASRAAAMPRSYTAAARSVEPVRAWASPRAFQAAE